MVEDYEKIHEKIKAQKWDDVEEQSKKLCFRGSKFSFFLMLLFSTPVIFRTHQILTLWLFMIIIAYDQN